MKLIDKDTFWNKYEQIFSPEIIVATWFISPMATLVLTSNVELALFVCTIMVAITTWSAIEYSEYQRKK